MGQSAQRSLTGRVRTAGLILAAALLTVACVGLGRAQQERVVHAGLHVVVGLQRDRVAVRPAPVGRHGVVGVQLVHGPVGQVAHARRGDLGAGVDRTGKHDGAAEDLPDLGHQREGAEHAGMAAGPGSKVYGRLSVMLQAYCQVTSLFVVPPGAFRPPPKVDSAVVRLVPRDPATININDHKRFAEVVKAAFGQRRKTLRNALNNVVSAEQFVAAGVRPDARAEQLDVAEFIALANATAV